MKLVIDTNVFVSAVLRGGLPARVLESVIVHDDWQWTVTSDLLAEYERVVLRAHLAIPIDAQEEWLRLTRQDAIQIDVPLPSVEFPRDRKDIHVLQAAIIGEADYLITGDKDFGEAKKLVASKVVTVAEFARLFHIT